MLRVNINRKFKFFSNKKGARENPERPLGRYR